MPAGRESGCGPAGARQRPHAGLTPDVPRGCLTRAGGAAEHHCGWLAGGAQRVTPGRLQRLGRACTPSPACHRERGVRQGA